MSRIIIRNLPPSTTVPDLRTHFSTANQEHLVVTDAKLPSKRFHGEQISRRIGFVGYKTSDHAQRAKDWFDGTFFGSCKISVELVVDGLKVERPTKRMRTHAPKPAIEENVEPTPAPAPKAKKVNLKKGPSWANNPDLPTPTASVPYQPSERTEKSNDECGFLQPDPNKPLSDADWLKQHMQSGLRESQEVLQDVEVAEEAPNEAESMDSQARIRDEIMSTARLFVRNLTFSVTAEELEECFGVFGDIEQIHIPLTGPPNPTVKGFAYITFKQAPAAVRAYDELDGRAFQGRLVHILPAYDRKGREGDTKDKNVKDKKLESKKKDAVKGGAWDWGVLYMNSDAVADSIAQRFNVSKAAILQEDNLDEEEDGRASNDLNPAVKLALAETHVIDETRRYLAEQGIHLDAFDSSTKPRKSDTTLLIKNIPYSTATSELRTMFEPFGEIVRLVTPPAGTIAVIEYSEAVSASEAIRKLSYRRLGSSVIYIDRAPEGVWRGEGGQDSVIASRLAPRAVTIGRDGATAAQPIASGTTLYLKNLSFATTTESLARAFQHLPSFSFARVATKPDPKHPEGDSRLSMGFGFVGFSTVDAARTALKGMDGYVLQGHKLVVTFAGRGAEDEEVDEKGVGKAKTTKMIVKNVPFEASKKDIRQLFGAHGQLRSVRLPKRFDARSRGFAFLDFISRNEAEQAYAALRHTHLLGRHLVLEWAEDSQDIDVLREKIGVGFGAGKSVPGKKRKLDFEDLDAGIEE